MANQAGSDGLYGVYWVGADGNVYTQGNDGRVASQGKAINAHNAGFDASLSSGAYRRIDDPNPPQEQQQREKTQNAPAGGGYSGGGAAARAIPQLNQGAVNNTQATINEIPGLLQAALAAEDARYGNITSAFNADEKVQRGQHGESTTTNQQNYDANFMDSIRAGIKGLSGLTQLLRGSGASGGSAQDQVGDIVGGITSQDIRGGADTQKENQISLDNSLSGFLTSLKNKRAENEDTFANNKRAISRDSNTQLQDLYGKMAGFYGDAERFGEADSWMGRSSALTPGIARDSQAQVSKYDRNPIKVASPEITAFAGNSQPGSIAKDSTGNQVGSGIFTLGGEEKKKKQTLAGV